MANKITNTQHYSDIADAIRAKAKTQDTYTPAQMAQAIAAISTDNVQSEPMRSDVNFYNGLTGERLYAYTTAEFAEMDEFPAAPDIPGLDFVFWTAGYIRGENPELTVEYVKSWGRKINIFALYAGDTPNTSRLGLDIINAVELTLNIFSRNGVTIDYGDGTPAESIVGNMTLTHTYAPGRYECVVSGGAHKLGSNGSNGVLCKDPYATSTINASCLTYVIAGNGVEVGSYALEGQAGLEYVACGYQLASSNIWPRFNYCANLLCGGYAEGTNLNQCRRIRHIAGAVPAPGGSIEDLYGSTPSGISSPPLNINDVDIVCTNANAPVFSGISARRIRADYSTTASALYRNCYQLEDVNIPATVKTIQYNAFSGCSRLRHIDLPAGLEHIYGSAFTGCSALDDVVIPANVVDIGNSYQSCTALTNVTFLGQPTTINAAAFSGCTALTTIRVPWSQDAVANAPWGAANATIIYDYTGGNE